MKYLWPEAAATGPDGRKPKCQSFTAFLISAQGVTNNFLAESNWSTIGLDFIWSPNLVWTAQVIRAEQKVAETLKNTFDFFLSFHTAFVCCFRRKRVQAQLDCGSGSSPMPIEGPKYSGRKWQWSALCFNVLPPLYLIQHKTPQAVSRSHSEKMKPTLSQGRPLWPRDNEWSDVIWGELRPSGYQQNG